MKIYVCSVFCLLLLLLILLLLPISWLSWSLFSLSANKTLYISLCRTISSNFSSFRFRFSFNSFNERIKFQENTRSWKGNVNKLLLCSQIIYLEFYLFIFWLVDLFELFDITKSETLRTKINDERNFNRENLQNKQFLLNDLEYRLKQQTDDNNRLKNGKKKKNNLFFCFVWSHLTKLLFVCRCSLAHEDKRWASIRIKFCQNGTVKNVTVVIVLK